MSWFNIRKGRTPEQRKKNFDRIMAEDLCDQGYTCEEVAEMVGATQQEIYRLKNAKTRREARTSGKSVSESDELSQMNIELKKLELEKKKQELEWQLEDRKAERAEEIAEAMAGGDDDNSEKPDWVQNIIQPLATRWLAGRSKPNGGDVANSFDAPVDAGASQQLPTPPPQAADLTDEEIDDVLQSYKKQVQQLEKMSISVVEKSLRAYFPNFTDSTYERAAKKISKQESLINT